MPPPSSTRQPSRAGGAHQFGLQRPVDDVGDPQVAGAAAPPASGSPGVRPCRWAWRGPARRPRPARRAAGPRSPPTARPAPKRSPQRVGQTRRARSRVEVDHGQPLGAQRRAARGRRRSRRRPRRAGRRRRGRRRAGRGRRTRAKPDQSVLCPMARPSAEDDGVHRAQGLGVGGQLVEVRRARAACRGGSRSARRTRPAGRRPAGRPPPPAGGRSRRDRAAGRGSGCPARRPPARAAAGSATGRCRCRPGRPEIRRPRPTSSHGWTQVPPECSGASSAAGCTGGCVGRSPRRGPSGPATFYRGTGCTRVSRSVARRAEPTRRTCRSVRGGTGAAADDEFAGHPDVLAFVLVTARRSARSATAERSSPPRARARAPW